MLCPECIVASSYETIMNNVWFELIFRNVTAGHNGRSLRQAALLLSGPEIDGFWRHLNDIYAL